MSYNILFVASLHHPEQLLKEIAATPADETPALFPTSMGQHFWERAMKKYGHTVDVFWRNLPGFGKRDIESLQAEVFREGLTLGKFVRGAMQKLPPKTNPDTRRRNQLLIEKARNCKPNILWLIGDNTVIYPDTLLAIKNEHKCLIVYASGTSPIVFSHPIERQAARLYDLVLVNDFYHGMQWLELGAKHAECLPIAAIDPEFHHPQQLSDEEKAKYACELGFVGTLVPTNLYSERVQALETVRDFDLGVWSVHDVPSSLKTNYRGYALGKEMLRVLSGVTISLNIHGDFMRYGGNMRLFETAALQTFQLVDNRPGVTTWFNLDDHLATFTTPDELREKVRYYLDHPDDRDMIASAAHQHVLKHHTYDHRWQKVEEILNETFGSVLH